MRIVDPKCIVGIRQYNEAVPLRQRVMADSANLLPYFFFSLLSTCSVSRAWFWFKRISLFLTRWSSVDLLFVIKHVSLEARCLSIVKALWRRITFWFHMSSWLSWESNFGLILFMKINSRVFVMVHRISLYLLLFLKDSCVCLSFLKSYLSYWLIVTPHPHKNITKQSFFFLKRL